MTPIARLRELLSTRLSTGAEEARKRAVLWSTATVAIVLVNLAAILVTLAIYGRRVVAPLVALGRSLKAMLGGDRASPIGYQDEDSEIGDVARCLETYRITTEDVERQRWVKSSVAEIGKLLQLAEDPGDSSSGSCPWWEAPVARSTFSMTRIVSSGSLVATPIRRRRLARANPLPRSSWVGVLSGRRLSGPRPSSSRKFRGSTSGSPPGWAAPVRSLDRTLAVVEIASSR